MYDSATQVEDYSFNVYGKDNLVDQWLLVNTPFPSIVVLFIYYLFVLKIGPNFMKKRKPYNLNIVMRVYNIVQVLGNIRLLCYPCFYIAKDMPYILELSCKLPKATDDNIDELVTLFLHLTYEFVVLKILDLLDTVFMVLRKKNSQITFLHLYHHGIMVFGSWFTLKYMISLQSVLPAAINTAVHTIMYGYFFLATFGEPVQKYLWWKKYLTKLQLVQFVFILMYIFTLYYKGCPISKVFTYFWLFNVFIIFCLFVNFYFRAYVVKPKHTEIDKTL